MPPSPLSLPAVPWLTVGRLWPQPGWGWWEDHRDWCVLITKTVSGNSVLGGVSFCLIGIKWIMVAMTQPWNMDPCVPRLNRGWNVMVIYWSYFQRYINKSLFSLSEKFAEVTFSSWRRNFLWPFQNLVSLWVAHSGCRPQHMTVCIIQVMAAAMVLGDITAVLRQPWNWEHTYYLKFVQF